MNECEGNECGNGASVLQEGLLAGRGKAAVAALPRPLRADQGRRASVLVRRRRQRQLGGGVLLALVVARRRFRHVRRVPGGGLFGAHRPALPQRGAGPRRRPAVGRNFPPVPWTRPIARRSALPHWTAQTRPLISIRLALGKRQL